MALAAEYDHCEEENNKVTIGASLAALGNEQAQSEMLLAATDLDCRLVLTAASHPAAVDDEIGADFCSMVRGLLDDVEEALCSRAAGRGSFFEDPLE